MALNRLIEIAAAIEDTPGTLQPSIYAAANARHLVVDPNISYEPAVFRREFKRSTLTGIEGLMGMKPGTATFGIELAGHENATPDIPLWDLFLKACGWKSVTTEIAAFTSETGGPFRHGETITGGTSGSTAIVVHDTYGTAAGAGNIRVYAASDAFTAAETITGGDSGAAATITADFIDSGQSWWPISQETVLVTHTGTDPSVGDVVTQVTSGAGGIVTAIDAGAGTFDARLHTAEIFDTAGDIAVVGGVTITGAQVTAVAPADIPTISIAVNVDGTVQYLRGCRGNVEITGTVGEPVMMRFSFQGVSVNPVDAALLTGVTYESKTPPLFLTAAMVLGHEGDTDNSADYSPAVNAFALNLNNEVSPRTSVNDAGGIVIFTISDRDASGTLDPEKTLEANYPWIQDFLGGDIWRGNFNVGTAEQNMFHVSLPGLQTTAAPHADRGGILTRNLAIQVTGGHKTNVSGTLGSDNEIVISYDLDNTP